MHYQEFQPSPFLSQHIECFWEMELRPGELDHRFEVLTPDCTFEIIFCKEPVFVKLFAEKQWTCIQPGASFLGQKTGSLNLELRHPARIFGVRFKPFAFANLIDVPLYQLTDKILLLDKLFRLSLEDRQSVNQLVYSDDLSEKIPQAETLMKSLLEDSYSVDQHFRAQINYILDRKGVLKVKDMFSEFGVSKVTLHKHFLHKMGLSPKMVSRIWRLNYLLQLKKENPDMSLTELGYEAGFYDQAHFIKEFRSFFGECPRTFFQKENKLVGISQEIIARRFTNQYDPRQNES